MLTVSLTVPRVAKIVVLGLACDLLGGSVPGSRYSAREATAQNPAAAQVASALVSPLANPESVTAPSPVTAASPAAASSGSEGLKSLPAAPRQSLAKVTAGNGSLPNAQGQVWREYDITPYTQRLATTARPEQVITDWILRETGYEAWHGDVLTILSADSTVLRVYHTPEIQTQVSEIVDRFVNPDPAGESFSMRLVSVDSPAWRAKAARILRPLPTQTPGLQAWVVAKEEAALLIAEARKRTDYREHSPPQLLAGNGQALKSQGKRPRTFVQGFQPGGNAWQGLLPVTGRIEEGYSAEVTPLVSLDEKSVEAMIRCDIDQVEKIHAIPIDLPAANGAVARTQLEVPQTSSIRVHERFRWPLDQVLIVALGVVPSPVPNDAQGGFLPLVSTAPPRVDLMLVVEPRGKIQSTTAAAQRGIPSAARR